jgi:cytidylate kinase
MSTITISRQMGSQGNEIAWQVAQQLGWRRVNREVINRSALAARVPQVALAEIDELGLFGLRPSAKEWRAYQSQVEQFIHNLADEGGVVIVGRGGQVVLRDRTDVLHVRVIAPFEARVSWLQQKEKISVEAAQARLKESLKARAQYLQRSYGVQVDDPTLYHLIINTGLVNVSQATGLVVQAFQVLTGSVKITD